MQNPFLVSTIRLIKENGLACSFVRVQEGIYNFDTGAVTNTETSTDIKAYKRHITANQYNYPNMIGKELAEFYIASSNFTTKPTPTDKIVFSGETFSIISVREYHARGQLVLYTIIAVKS